MVPGPPCPIPEASYGVDVLVQSPTTNDVQRARWDLPLLVGIAVVGVVLRLRQYLAARSMWLDETSLAEGLVEAPFPQVLTEPLKGNQSAPPGYVFWSKVNVEAFGTSEYSLRLVALVAGIATLAVAVVVALRLLRHLVSRAAFVGMVALSPVLIYYANEVKQYSVDALAMMTILLLWSLRATRHSPGWLGLGGLAIAVMSMTGMFGLAALGLALAVEWWVARRADLGGSTSGTVRKRDGVGGWGLGDWAVVAGMWAVGGVLHLAYTAIAGTDREYMVTFWSNAGAFPPGLSGSFGDLVWYPEWLQRLAWVGTATPGRLGSVAAAEAWVPGVLLALVIGVLLVVGLWRRRDLWVLFGGTFVIMWVAAEVRVYPTSGRLSLYLVPFVLFGIATGIDAALSSRQVVRNALGIASAVLLVVIPAAISLPLFVEPLNDRDAKWLVAEVADRAQPGDAIAHAGYGKHRWYVAGTKAADYPSYRISPTKLEASGLPEDVGWDGYQRIWAVANHSFSPTKSMVDLLVAEQGFVLMCEYQPPGTYLALLVRSDIAPTVDRTEVCAVANPR